MANICPSCYDGAQYHQAEGEKRRSCDGGLEEKYFLISNRNDLEVLEIFVDGNREILQCFCASIGHPDEEKGDRKPLSLSAENLL